MAIRLALIIALAGLVPIAAVGVTGVIALNKSARSDAEETMKSVAVQAAGRIDSYLVHQKELVRSVAAVAEGPQAERRLQEAVLDAPTLGQVQLLAANDSPPVGITPAELA